MTQLLMKDSPFWLHIATEICKITQSTGAITNISPVTGGDISHAFRIEIDDQPYFIKMNTATNLAMFKTEDLALKTLHPTSPIALCSGSFGEYSYIILEWLNLHSAGDEYQLGVSLAQLHQRNSNDRYGWQHNNFIGTTPQNNTWLDNWCEFWLRYRIGYQYTLALKNGYGTALSPLWQNYLKAVSLLLENHHPKASLLHGDLWRGNAGFNEAKPIIFDPACYYGDRETDIALTELFGGFSADFYKGYKSIWPLDKRYRIRKHVYNTYHLLNHLNLFGEGYLGQCITTMKRIISEVNRNNAFF